MGMGRLLGSLIMTLLAGYLAASSVMIKLTRPPGSNLSEKSDLSGK